MIAESVPQVIQLFNLSISQSSQFVVELDTAAAVVSYLQDSLLKVRDRLDVKGQGVVVLVQRRVNVLDRKTVFQRRLVFIQEIHRYGNALFNANTEPAR